MSPNEGGTAPAYLRQVALLADMLVRAKQDLRRLN
jgi:hypothetical protein